MGQCFGGYQTAPLISAGAQSGPSNDTGIQAECAEPQLPLSTPPSECQVPALSTQQSGRKIFLISRDAKAFEISKAAAQLSNYYGPTLSYMEDLYGFNDSAIIEINASNLDSTMLELIATYINGRAATENDEAALQNFHRQFLPAGETAKELLDEVAVASGIAEIPTLIQLVSEKIKGDPGDQVVIQTPGCCAWIGFFARCFY